MSVDGKSLKGDIKGRVDSCLTDWEGFSLKAGQGLTQ